MNYYQLTPEAAKELRKASPALTAAEWRLWSLLVTLDPFGETYQDMPDLLVILEECGLSKSTFYAALSKFEALQLFDTQPIRIAFRNLRGKGIVRKIGLQSEESDSSPKNRKVVREIGIQSEESESEKMKPAQGATSEKPECTNKRSNKNLKRTIGTKTDAPPSLNSGVLGTELDPSNPYEAEVKHFLMLATQADIRTNGSITKTLYTLRSQRSAAETLRSVENSISAVVEMMEQGKARDPGALLNASLQREINGQGFTANEAKRDARGRRAEPELNTVALGVSEAIARNDRAWALGRLQQLWSDGYHNLLEEMLHLFRREWQFSLTNEGVRDAHET